MNQQGKLNLKSPAEFTQDTAGRLIRTLRVGEGLEIGDVQVYVKRNGENKAEVSVTAPKSVPIKRIKV